MAAYRDHALVRLRQAIDSGFQDVTQLKSDPNLEPLRSQEGFQSLVTELESQHNDY